MSHVPTESCVQSGTFFVKNKCITEPPYWHVSGSPMSVNRDVESLEVRTDLAGISPCSAIGW